MTKRIISAIIALIMVTTCLTGCNTKTVEAIQLAMSQNTDIQITADKPVTEVERAELTWVELDQLDTFMEIRKTWDNELNIVKFDKGSKNGPIYIDTNGNWTGNNVLYNIFQNKEFVKNYWGDSKVRETLANKAVDEFSDISSISTGIYASVNAYFNIMQTNADGTSGLMNNLSRKEVMTIICRADTPVKELSSSEFDAKFGANVYNKYAEQLKDCSYFKIDNNSLNAYTYNGPCTRAEAIYMIVQRYFKEEYDALDVTGVNPFTDCSNAGDVLASYEITPGYSWQTYSLEHCLQNKEDGVSEDLFKALVVANRHGVISNTTNWSSTIMGGELLKMIISAYESMHSDSYPVNAKTGYNEGDKLESGESSEEEEVLDGITIPTEEPEESTEETEEAADTTSDEVDGASDEADGTVETSEGENTENTEEVVDSNSSETTSEVVND